ncbi:MAG: putative lipid II flippase FtsW [Bacillota bacterium]
MQAKRRSADMFIFLAALSLLGIGVIMVFSASAVNSLKGPHQDPLYFLRRQLIWSVLGIGAMTVMMHFDYRKLRSLVWIVFPTAILLLVLVLFVGENINGSRRWIDLGFLTIQPSEIAKFSTILTLAFWLSELRDGVKSFLGGIVIPLCMVGIVCFLIMLEPDFGTMVVIFGSSFLLIFAAGARLWHLGLIGSTGLLGGIVLALAEPYRRERLTSFLDPMKDPLGSGWQIIQSLYALGSGGLFGLGLGRGRQKFSYLPEPHTDFIFACLGEELGFIGTMLVVTLFFLFAWRGLRVAINCKDLFGSLLAIGITCMIVVQAILNIGVVTSSLPVTGITLPLISSGGSSLVITLGSIGVLLNISKQVSEK